MRLIHDTAVIDIDAELGDDVHVGPFAVITGRVRIGAGSWIGAHAVIGAPPEVRSVDPAEATSLGDTETVVIGERCVLREAVQVHSGWKAPTVIGDDAYIMNQTYIAHDGRLGDRVTLAAGVRLGGNVHIDEGANLGLGTVVHQGRTIGALAMVGMGSAVTRDIPPFAKAFGSPAILHGANSLGLERSGAGADDIRWALAADLTAPTDVPRGLAPAFAWFNRAVAR